MKNFFSVMICLLVLATGVFAQSQTDKVALKIDTQYEQAARDARLCETDDDQGSTGPLVMNTLTINSRGHQWRAVGIYEVVYKFFYKGVDNDEKRLYPDQLVIVHAERKISNRQYSEEYLFSERGSLIHYRQMTENDETSPASRYIYFSAGRAVRIVEDGKINDKLAKSDIAAASRALNSAASIQGLFKRSIKL